MLYYLCLICSIITTITLSYFNNYFTWEFCYVPFLLFIAFSLLYFALTFIILFLIALPIKKKKDFCPKHSNFYRCVMDEGLIFLMKMARIKIHFENKDLIPQDQRFLIVSNHKSKFDPMVVNAYLKGFKISWITKRSLFKMPLVSNYMYKTCFMPLDRDNLRQGLEVINQASEYINENQCSIGVYPEGTRNTTNETLLPFKPGALKVAYKTKAPIVALVCLNTELVSKNWPYKKTDIYIKVCKTFYYEEYKNYSTNDLAIILNSLMKDELENMKKVKYEKEIIA